MSSETLDFEKDYQKELDRVYGDLGYEVVKRIIGKENRLFDVILKRNGREAKIEEKALQYYYPDCPIELIQNIWPKDLGWFYETKADFVHFFYYRDMQPFILYQIFLKKLTQELPRFFGEDNWREMINARFSIINYGITLNLCIKWDYLIKKKCAFILKRW